MKIFLKASAVFYAAIAAWLGGAVSVRAQVSFSVNPSAVSNTYPGTIALTITGLASAGDSVVVQKFLDVNTNGVADAGDDLVQQFELTDGQPGMVIGGVTNLNVPGDTDPTANQITAQLNFRNGDFVQNIAGRFIYVLSSPSGEFSPITRTLTVTNCPYAQQISGTVMAGGAAVSNAVVLLFPAPRGGNHGPGTPVAGTVADRSGNYSFPVPPGTYVPMAFGSNYVASYAASPVLTLADNQTVTTNLALTAATASISGQMVDALNSGVALPGVFMPAMNKSEVIAIGFSDTNGGFNIQVGSGQWNFGSEDRGLIVQGYVGYNNGTNLSAGTTGFVAPFFKSTALFYGSVKDDSGNPLAGIDVNANDSNDNVFQSDGFTGADGKYAVGVVGNLGNGDPWQVQVGNGSGNPTNYVFSQPQFDQNGGTNLAAGQALKVGFTALLATNEIAGNVQFDGTNVVGVGVYAYATIGGLDYRVDADSDANGNYSFNVANGTWNVGINQSGDGGLDNMLGSGNYQLPAEQPVGINDTNGTANFTIQPCNGVQILTTNLPDGQVNAPYDQWLMASSCGNLSWSLVPASGQIPSGLTLDSDGELHGTPNASGASSFSVQADDGNGHVAQTNLSLYIAPASAPLQINTTSLPNGTNGVFYSQTLQASGGTPPYTWSIPNYSQNPPPSLTLSTNGILSGTISTNYNIDGVNTFDVQVEDAASVTMDQTLNLNVVSPPLEITNASLPAGTVGAAYNAPLGATGGHPPYSWRLAASSRPLPAGLSLDSGSGLISGAPGAADVGTNYFEVEAYDGWPDDATKVLSIAVYEPPTISSPAVSFGNGFQMTVNAAANQSYTVQMSTNLASTNWIPLLVTNPSGDTFLFSDPHATNSARYYRVLAQP